MEPSDSTPGPLQPTLAGPPGAAPAAPPEDLVGTVLAGRYRILKRLGEGAMGAVYLGEHVKIGRRDAIKLLRGSLARDTESMARFTRGARNLSILRHPNLCTIYDFSDTDDGLQFLAMELVEGETLKDVLDREGTLSPERAASLTHQAAEALQVAHDAGIVHRDLKPANLMITRGRGGAEVVKVVDFDIAKGPSDAQEVEVTQMGYAIGTPEYMSPEQLMVADLDGRSDTYSLAIVLFRMLTGVLPFRSQNTRDLVMERLTQKPLRLDEVAPGAAFPPGLQEALDRALSMKPDERQADVADFGREVWEAATGAAGAAVARMPAPASAPRTAAPATVASPVTGAGTVSGVRRPAGLDPAPPATSVPARPRSRTPLYAGAGVALAGTALALFLWLGSPADAEEPVGKVVPLEDTSGEVALAAESDAAGAIPSNIGEPLTQETSGTAPGQMPEPGAPAEPRSAEAATEARPPGTRVEQPRVDEPRSAPPARTAPAENVKVVLMEQLERVGPPYPSESTLRSIQSRIRAIWDAPGTGPDDRALAAYILSTTMVPLGERSECLRWVDEALRLRPDYRGYRAQRAACEEIGY